MTGCVNTAVYTLSVHTRVRRTWPRSRRTDLRNFLSSVRGGDAAFTFNDKGWTLRSTGLYKNPLISPRHRSNGDGINTGKRVGVPRVSSRPANVSPCRSAARVTQPRAISFLPFYGEREKSRVYARHGGTRTGERTRASRR